MTNLLEFRYEKTPATTANRPGAWPIYQRMIDMKTVPLRGKKAAGRVTRMDDGDYKVVAPYRWNIWNPRPGQGPYAITTIILNGCKRTVRMHNLITGLPRVDHRDGDGLNNQRSNLRAADNRRNGQNRRKQAPATASRFKGVTWRDNQPLRPWAARITIDGKLRWLGSFAAEDDAAREYDAAAMIAFGEFAWLNFPEEDNARTASVIMASLEKAAGRAAQAGYGETR